MTEEESQRYVEIITFTTNLEHVGDIIDKNLMELARKRLYQARRFSDAGWAEILEFHGLAFLFFCALYAPFAIVDLGRKLQTSPTA
jgi:Na+/phosphate symporter